MGPRRRMVMTTVDKIIPATPQIAGAIATGEAIGVKDVNEFYPDWKVNPAAQEYCRSLVGQLDRLMPAFLNNLRKFL